VTSAVGALEFRHAEPIFMAPRGAEEVAASLARGIPSDGEVPDEIEAEIQKPAPSAVVLVGLGAGCVALRRYVGRRVTA
jgi:hypothetical protein